MSAEVARILRDAADLIEPKGCWTQGASARDAHGYPMSPMQEQAKAWCAWGALVRAAGDADAMSVWKAERIVCERESMVLDRWNDDPERSQAEVVAALRAAADEAEAP